MTAQWWSKTNGNQLAQGDLLPDCLMPVFTGAEFNGDGAVSDEVVKQARLIVITQSCDLANSKVEYVALCPVHSISEFEAANPAYKTSRRWESVRKGRVEALHLLASPECPDDNREALVADFGHIVSIPLDYLSEHAAKLENRWRLDPPFLEHFSQAFARFFMRVGLPSGIPPYK